MVHNLYFKIISLENLFAAYYKFRKGKRKRKEVAEFELNLEENIFSLHSDLINFSYQHSAYFSFKICDPKPRIIHKATVRDRVAHQAVCQILNPIFDAYFIFDSYSSRENKGTHAAVKRLNDFVRQISKNYKNPCFAAKFDVEKFFYSVDHQILIKLLKRKINCPKTIWLCQRIISSFKMMDNKGLPLGNVTSQLFANIYLNELDIFIKKDLREKYYLRFCDDFIILRKNCHSFCFSEVNKFLKEQLLLGLKKDKIITRKLSYGFDFLGYVVLSHHQVLRPKTKNRMLKNITQKKTLFNNSLITVSEFKSSLNL